jgi:hypothetical protein
LMPMLGAGTKCCHNVSHYRRAAYFGASGHMRLLGAPDL